MLPFVTTDLYAGARPFIYFRIYPEAGSTGDGASPHATLIADSNGNLYGTTVSGGIGGTNCRGGCGTVYMLTAAAGKWQETVLYRFSGGADGAVPYAGVVMDSAGNRYGATVSGGAFDAGFVYKLTPNSTGAWTQTVLYTFEGHPDGEAPYATPILLCGHFGSRPDTQARSSASRKK